MRTPELLATFLLVHRIIAVIFMTLVVKKQWSLFKLHIPDEVSPFRKMMFLLSLTLLVANFVPIIFDIYYGYMDSPKSVEWLFTIYLMGNAVSAAASAVLIWWIYKLAGKADNDNS